MTLKELLAKNAAIDAERAQRYAAEAAARKQEELAQEQAKAQESVVEQQVSEESEECIREHEERAPKSQRKGKKPVNRAYMVVENVNNEEPAEQGDVVDTDF